MPPIALIKGGMRLLSILCALVAVSSLAARAEIAARVDTERASTVLAAEAEGLAPGGRLDLVFAQSLKPGWHVYWSNPGDSGLPLAFDWTLPDGFIAGPIEYPAPERIPLPPLVNYGHVGDPVFRTSLAAPADARAGDVVTVALRAQWLICADVCVPETGEFRLAIPIVDAPQLNANWRAVGDASRAAAPQQFSGEATFSQTGDRIFLSLDPAPAEGGYFFAREEGLIEPSGAQIAKIVSGRLILAALVRDGADGSAPPSLSGVFQGDGATAALLIEASPTQQPLAELFDAEKVSARADAGSLGALALAAFVGGLILNLMPCVFPILFIKAAQAAHVAASGRALREGVLYSVGVLGAFAALASLLIALRAAGESVGWGFHLQSPAAVLVSAWVLALVALNFAGIFTVGESLVGIGPQRALGGDFGAVLTGAFAVFVAAPCIGPFLTAPVGFAAAAPPAAALSIFLAMGAGFALPFALVTASPQLAQRLPKPGPWMSRLRFWLAIPVALAAAYFFWVLERQIGARGLAVSLAGAALLGLAATLWENSKRAGGSGGFMAAAVACAAIALGAFSLQNTRNAESPAPLQGIETVAFDKADLARRRAAGEAIFIDFTAAWCVTCQVNKLTVLSDKTVLDAFRKHRVTFVTADWTRRDAVIADALAEFGAAGVPLNVYYPASGEPVIFAQPLQAGAIKAALEAR
jgi:thiol:disulfide interchange protein DsbD